MIPGVPGGDFYAPWGPRVQILTNFQKNRIFSKLDFFENFIPTNYSTPWLLGGQQVYEPAHISNSGAELRSRHRAKNESDKVSEFGDPGGAGKRTGRVPRGDFPIFLMFF